MYKQIFFLKKRKSHLRFGFCKKCRDRADHVPIRDLSVPAIHVTTAEIQIPCVRRTVLSGSPV